ncbi:MAG: hypothetical protein M0Q91_05270 [Methanoregula sp.]|jgi:hypothetical protein|nr:hypothetical protein [Methanoregula sp.]
MAGRYKINVKDEGMFPAFEVEDTKTGLVVDKSKTMTAATNMRNFFNLHYDRK